MRKIIAVGILSLLVLSGVALAQQSGEEKTGPSRQGTMQEMMKGGGSGESGMGGMGGMMGMGGMGGMMRMMKMMGQCSAMMGGQTETQKSK